MTQIKTKEEFQEKQKQLEKDYRTKPKNPKYKVTPNLTPRGIDIIMRLQNKSLDTTGERSYTLNEDIVNARMKSKHEIIKDAQKNASRIKGLKDSLEKFQSQPKTKNETNEPITD